MNRNGNERDLTANQRGATPVHAPTLMLTKCEHKGYRTGALMRGQMPYLCAACNAKEKT